MFMIGIPIKEVMDRFHSEWHKLVVNPIDHPPHYGGADDPYEVIKVIEAWDLDFCLGNVLKYIGRAGKKDPAKLKEDLEKAKWYLERRISKL